MAMTSRTALLLQHPYVLDKLVKASRSQFQAESEISTFIIYQLHYLRSVIQESLRLFPTIANGYS